MSKYKARKVQYRGKIYDSKKEARRAVELTLLERAGKISDLQMQVKFVLIPTQREADTVGARGGIKKGKVIEKECAYYADFVYKDANGKTVVEDTKGFRTADYIIKRKLMLYIHGVKIVEL